MNSYEAVFAKFDENNGKFLFTWNWYAFLLGIFWYIYKGMWAKSIIYLVGAVILGASTGGFGAILAWIAYGVFGNYDLYLFDRSGHQLWGKGDSFTPISSSANNSGTSYEVKLRTLQDMQQKGLISADEYAKKRDLLVKEMENAELLRRLEEGRRLGVLTEQEFQAKRSEVLAGNVA